MPFRNPDDLVRALEYLRDDILPTYAKPLWEDPQLLRQFINRFYSEQDATNEMKEVESKRRQAEAAFRAGNYSETVNLYRGFSPVDLTTTDQKRFEIARRKMSQS